MRSLSMFYALFLIFLTALSPQTAAAERFADLFVGGTFGGDQDIKYSAPDVQMTVVANVDRAGTLGYRMGYWLNSAPSLGLALEVSYFKQEYGNDAKVKVVPITPLLMARLQLMKSASYPKGEWLPYLAAGPGIFLTSIDYEAADSPLPDLLGHPHLTGRYKDDGTCIGLDARAGIKKMLVYNFAVFAEYRYTSFNRKYENSVLGAAVDTKVDLDTHHFVFGLTHNF